MSNEITSKLQQKMMELGRKNGFAPPKSQDPLDAVLHELFVSAIGRTVYDKRYKLALEAAQSYDEKRHIDHTVDAVKKAGIAQSATILTTENYIFNLAVRAPIDRFDKTAARNELVKAGVDPALVAAAFEKATGKNAPAKVFTVQPT